MILNVEQRKIVEQEPTGPSLVRGVAGSGKTTVAIKRVPFLIKHYCHEDDDNILVLTFNKTLLNFIKFQYDKVEEEDQLSFDGFFTKSDNQVKISTVDSMMFNAYMKYCHRQNLKYDIASLKDSMMVLQKTIYQLKEQYPDVKLLSTKYANFLLNEIEWIKASNIVDLAEYQAIDRIGRSSGQKGMPQKLTKNSETRAAIFNLMVTHEELLKQDELVDFKTMNNMALKFAKEDTVEKYTHILIDESQDLTKTQLEFIKCLYKEKMHSSILFVADNTQSIYPHSWLGKGRTYTTIGFDMSGKSRTLRKNYRTTTQISEAAYSLVENDEGIVNNVDFVKPALLERNGQPPIYRFFKKQEDQFQYVLDEILSLESEYELSDICIVSREKRSLTSMQSYFDGKIACELLIDHKNEPDFKSESIKLITMHSIKGLEFKVIFLIDLNDGILPSSKVLNYDEEGEGDERRLLYVGMTRANELLYMTSAGRPSKFIMDIDNRKMTMYRDCKVRPYRTISTYDYHYQTQIIDINSKEEMVRQWVIKELNEAYDYPLNQIEIEKCVQHFSKTGYVDISVSILHNGQLTPYIFVETKKYGSGIDNAIEQLKSYMNASETVSYGIATDGMDFRVLDKSKDIITDIPKCHPKHIQTKQDKQHYLNLKSNKSYDYSVDMDDSSIISISEYGSRTEIQPNGYVNIPVVGDVIAGIPNEAFEYFNEEIVLPSEWVIQAENTFGLNVTGDSMKNAGIDKGDIVIVNKQEIANSGDIVIALIGNDATVKKFIPMGDSILLLSENVEYEPIQMRSDEVRINGRVIGVLKKNFS